MGICPGDTVISKVVLSEGEENMETHCEVAGSENDDVQRQVLF